MIQNFELIEKNKLTNDIFELHFKSDEYFDFIPGQFITFLLEVGWRAYSILEENWNELVLIIKKRELKNWWRGWSKFLCEMNIWDKIKWVWPAGHFILKESNENKLFLWTWTGFVPLYNQIKYSLKAWKKNNFKLIFWARTEKDLFYLENLEELKSKYSNFDYEIYLSNEKSEEYNNWYVTNFINSETINSFSEAYICWIPAMIDSAKEILKDNWFLKENIFTEKY